MSEVNFKPIFDYMDQKFEEQDKKNLDLFVSKSEFNTRMDEQMVILKRLDQERIFTTEWIRRIESEVDQHTKEIGTLKQNLGIS